MSKTLRFKLAHLIINLKYHFYLVIIYNIMRKVILGLAVTLDGYIEGPNGEYDWCFTDQDYGLTEFFSRIDAVLIGRKSYEVAQEYAAATNGQLAPGMPPATTYVFSMTLEKVKDGEVSVRENIGAEVRKIKEQPGKDIWLYGGASLTDALMREGLVKSEEHT